jgi:hypothetical protein
VPAAAWNALSVFIGTLPLLVTFVLAVWNNNKRIDELSQRMTDLGTALNRRMDNLISRLSTIEQRLTGI